MDKKQEFLEVVAKYCDKDASEITELDEEEAIRITTIGEALEYMNTLFEE